MCCNVNVFTILIGFEEGRGFLCWTGSCLQTAASWPNCVVFTKFKTFWLHYKNVAWGILNYMLFYNLGQNSWKIRPPSPTTPSPPQPPTKIKDEKMVSFGSCLTPSLILGDGGLLFHFILSKIVANCELLLSKANP